MKYITDKLKEIKTYGDILDSISRKTKCLSVTGPSDSQKVHLCYAMMEHTGRKGFYVSYNEIQARRAYEDFSMLMGDEALLFPAREVLMHDIEARSNESVYERIKTVHRIIDGQYGVVVVSVEAAALKLIPPEVFKNSVIEVEKGSTLEPVETSKKLVSTGYERTHEVEARGQFALRGGILDIFAVNNSDPIRIELFGDEVESIRFFDPKSQRSSGEAEEVKIIPAMEVIYSDDALENIISRIKEDLYDCLETIRRREPERARFLDERVNDHIDRLSSDRHFPGIDKYIPYIAEPPSFFTDFAGQEDLVFIDDADRVAKSLETLGLDHAEACAMFVEKGEMLPNSCNTYFGRGDVENRLAKKTNIYLDTLPNGERVSKRNRFTIPSRSLGSYFGRMEILASDIKAWKERNYSIAVLAGPESRAVRTMQEFIRQGIEAVYTDDPAAEARPGKVAVMTGRLNKGFEYPEAGLVVVSEAELFRSKKPAAARKKFKKGREIDVFTELTTGDYVVHQVHGIGRYLGLEKLTVDNVKKDYLKIGYRNGDFLYIPSNQLDLVQRYIGVEGKAPRLNKLGGSEWLRTKKKVKSSLRKLAGELIELYARRETIKGFSYPPDTVWQKEFEETFPYEETDDQLRCTWEIKRDMESDRPVDRLLCGDVGYGKTEVAMRAAFKAVMGGKQVAVLVPTTVLAQQHYMTFTSRMRNFPVKVDVLSRFRLPGEQKRILNDVRKGGIDIIIGTHRMLSRDVDFKNLGLLVVDEEQRFGVIHKEKIKNLSPDIDVLTLTATPIPRTLHMSLAGIRDISVIEQPPDERYPVQTYVMEYDENVVMRAINRELARGGQVFYLSNRVRSIDTKVAVVKRLIPEARVAPAHGQMDERRLEGVMLKFINGEYDVLVCTTIIESGLDMPNVNTIIVEDADYMGLSQLYQLRGRVGRSNRVAYAYITYRRDKIVSEQASKRLQAIKEFTEFGSGFRIAMRDLEIRGAGNLLGPEQHGHMTAVGYDMYCRLLEQAVKELKGEISREPAPDLKIDIGISAYIDSDYIETEGHKIEMYKKIASIETEEDADDVSAELEDRFGDIPNAVRNLVDIAYMKALAAKTGITSIHRKGKNIVLEMPGMDDKVSGVIGKLAAKYRRKILFNAGSKPYLTYRAGTVGDTILLDNIKILLHDIKSFVENKEFGV